MEFFLQIIKRVVIACAAILSIFIICLVTNQDFVFIHNMISLGILIALALSSGILGSRGTADKRWDTHINYVASGEVERQEDLISGTFTFVFLNYAIPFFILSAIFLLY